MKQYITGCHAVCSKSLITLCTDRKVLKTTVNDDVRSCVPHQMPEDKTHLITYF